MKLLGNWSSGLKNFSCNSSLVQTFTTLCFVHAAQFGHYGLIMNTP